MSVPFEKLGMFFIKKLRPDAIVPQYAHDSDEDAGMDLFSVEDQFLIPFEPTLVKTGIAIELPPGIEGQVRPRSGMALKKAVTVWNAPGTIDPGYRGEIGVILLTADPKGVVINKGDKIAQLVLARYVSATLYEVPELGDTERGSGGFGSTGH